MILIRKIVLPVPGVELLQSEALDEGYDFIETLVEEWASGANRFDAPREALCGHLDQGLLVAVGGLNCDPFAGRPDMGRIRRVYVRPAWRNRGIGRALVAALVDHARISLVCACAQKTPWRHVCTRAWALFPSKTRMPAISRSSKNLPGDLAASNGNSMVACLVGFGLRSRAICTSEVA